ncbi:putative nucleolar complex protein 4 protein [Phaeoacremonium minimum UCRPA7]|uniref:Putative nucleolar complex protein 4 protein n=1 Tax=Phaeoacremonium minimum (strain UCR-PA7) TaxID=1286976 RepID=R8BEN1_PHAM7|nr:putative nucleolar complex protein 4 protein [Phaeoacremonium minimum UCRPA7]EON97753.1 putative nucleolar complex protein 4 protein [Phaeoacremonium minimum UCRPA7]
MPSAVEAKASKRKRSATKEPPKKRARSESSEENDPQAEILLLENAIFESKKNYNNITTLIEISQNHNGGAELALVAAVSLCRVFIKLLASGNLLRKKDSPEKEIVLVHWLRDRLAEYKTALLSMFDKEELATSALTVSMRLLKAEGQYLSEKDDITFPRVFLSQIVSSIMQPGVDDAVRKEYLEKFVDEFDDVRFYTFKAVTDLLASNDAETLDEALIGNVFDFLSSIEGVPASNEELGEFYVDTIKKKKGNPLFSISQHKKQAQEAWLALMSLGLTKDQKKSILDIMSKVVAPWFTKPELLMDFLTDCYNTGGSMSLLALSGVFYLIQERNLDYPLFYTKLYSLLDADILHSKHRSRFFRLLDTFLESSHLPAVLVASFIKRLARLSLNAPPSAIVTLIPWFYNLFKKHPLCTFMLHREPRTKEEKDTIVSEGLEDPFLPNEEDPMETHAIDSCLWEIVQLQSHYHPNVATITKIMSEQFTKQIYNLEDFLDHSYGSLLEAEMVKDVKKAPVIEFQIPKRVLLPQEPDSGVADNLLVKLWNFK